VRYREQLVEERGNRCGVGLGDRGCLVALTTLSQNPSFHDDFAVILPLSEETPEGNHLDSDEAAARQLPLVHPFRITSFMSDHSQPLSAFAVRMSAPK